MRKSILELFNKHPDISFSKTQIAKRLNIPGERKGELGGVLKDLISAKILIMGAKRLYSLKTEKKFNRRT